MNFGDIFKSIFRSKSCDRCKPNENVPVFFNEEDQDEYRRPHHHGGFEDVFRHFHGNMFQQMEELSRQMEDMFRFSGSMEFPPGFEEPYQKPPGNPRDYMLKEPDSNTEPQSQQPSRLLPPQDPGIFHPPSFFVRVSSPRWEQPDFGEFDEKDKVDPVVDIFNYPRESSPSPNDDSPSPVFGGSPFRSFTWSGSSSFSSQTIRGTDGKIEQRRTVKDSNGNEETTITRSIGDQTHTVTVKKDKTGATEKIENFQNMDQDDLSKFDDKWKKKQLPIEDNPRDKMINPQPSKVDKEEKESFLKKFFGL